MNDETTDGLFKWVDYRYDPTVLTPDECNTRIARALERCADALERIAGTLEEYCLIGRADRYVQGVSPLTMQEDE